MFERRESVIRVLIAVESLSQFPNRTMIEREARGIRECEGWAASAVEPLLRGKQAMVLLFFPPPAAALIADPTGERVHELDVRDTAGYEDGERVPPEESLLDHPPVPVETGALVEEILRWVGTRLLELPNEDVTKSAVNSARDTYVEACELYEQYHRFDTLETYEWLPSPDRVEAALFHPGAVNDDQVFDYLRREDIVADAVDELLASGNHRSSDRLDSLLRHRDDDIANRTIEVLYERAPASDFVVDALFVLIWSRDRHPHRVERAMGLFSSVGTEYAVERLVAELEVESDPDLRIAYARELGAIDGRRARDALRRVREEDPDLDVREAAAEALACS